MNILRPDWIDNLPNKTIDTYNLIGIEIIRVIIERILKIGKLSKSDLKNLTSAIAYYGADILAIEQIIADGINKSEGQIDDMFSELAKENDAFAEQYYTYRSEMPRNALNDRFVSDEVKSIIEITKGTGRNLSNTMAFKGLDGNYHNLRETYISYVDRAIFEIKGGIVNYDTAMKKAMKDLSQGIEYVDWASGYHRRLDSQVRQNLLDGLRQVNNLMLQYHGEKYGADGVELSAHPISAPDHVGVQGRQYLKEEFDKMQSGQGCVDYEGNYHAGFSRPIMAWNCRHYVFPIVLGVSTPFYSEKDLKGFEKSSAQKYDLTQKQRQKETELRKLKTQYRILQDTPYAKELKTQINLKQKGLRNFCKENELEYEVEKTRIY